MISNQFSLRKIFHQLSFAQIQATVQSYINDCYTNLCQFQSKQEIEEYSLRQGNQRNRCQPSLTSKYGVKPHELVDMHQLFELYIDFYFKFVHNLLDNNATLHTHFNSLQGIRADTALISRQLIQKHLEDL